MLGTIKERLEYDWKQKLFLILNDGWVYEGFIDEITEVLREVTGNIKDFYIVSPQFDRFVAYCNDGECLIFYE